MASKQFYGKLGIYGLVIIASLVFFSCITQKKLEYVRGPLKDTLIYQAQIPETIKIKSGDELYIRVSSFDDVAYNYFNNQADNRQMSFGNDISVSMVSYMVNDSGFILFPTLGKVYLKGLTIDEATKEMEIHLNKYFNQPTVLIKSVNKSISVLGEVRSPGRYIYTKNRLNIMEALGLAGDVTVHGIKQEVVLIRQTDQGVVKATFDLTDDAIFSSPFFYVQSNDIIYVKPRYSSRWSLTASMYSLILSSITAFILILDYVDSH